MTETAITPENYRAVADGIGNLVAPGRTNFIVQAEAAVALEAVAAELGHHTLLNLVSSRYGFAFGAWATAAGATVITHEAAPRHAFNVDEVDELLSAHPEISVLQFAHGEAITGILHSAAALIDIAHRHHVAVVLDAVATVAGVKVPASADVVVLGPQKAIEGAAGISVVSFAERGLRLLKDTRVTTPSVLSLRYLRDTWLASGRAYVPGTPPSLDLVATSQALDGLAHETLTARIARHEEAARTIRTDLRRAGFEIWSLDDSTSSPLATAVLLPSNVDVASIVTNTAALGEPWTHDVDGAPHNVVRTTHFGSEATVERAHARVNGLLQSCGIGSDDTDHNTVV